MTVCQHKCEHLPTSLVGGPLKSWKKKSKLSPSKRIKEIRKIKAETNYTKQVTEKKSTLLKVGSIKRLMK